MKATVDAKSLQRGLELVAGALENRTTLPILATIRVTARQTHPPLTAGVLQLHTTNLEQSIVVDVLADVVEPGERCVGGAKLIAVLKELPGAAELRLSHEDKDSGGGIQVRTTSGRWAINGFGAEDFPGLAPLAEGEAIVVKAESLAMALRTTGFATSKDESRVALNGVRFRIQGKQALVTATDGHRLVEVELPLDKGVEGTLPDVILPAGAIKSLLLILRGKQEAEIHLRHTIINNLDIVVDGARLSARLLDASFPNTEAIFDQFKGRPLLAQLSTKDLTAGLRQVAIMAEERNHPAKLAFAGDTLTLRSSAHDAGEAEVTLPLTWHGQPGVAEIGVNAHYVLDWLQFAPERITVSLKDGMAPLLFNGEEVDGKKTAPAYVVMPMRL